MSQISELLSYEHVSSMSSVRFEFRKRLQILLKTLDGGKTTFLCSKQISLAPLGIWLDIGGCVWTLNFASFMKVIIFKREILTFREKSCFPSV